MTETREIQIGSVRLGGKSPLALIAGPCVIESEPHAMRMAEAIAKIAGELKVPYIFKASYDKANRSSLTSYRGPGIAEGLRILRKIKEQFGPPILTDVHDVAQVALAAGVADVLQIPAFL
jgi:2-dehydro-3-deoxyphosphooctonate aldolase (KDO 8-P synthase)